MSSGKLTILENARCYNPLLIHIILPYKAQCIVLEKLVYFYYLTNEDNFIMENIRISYVELLKLVKNQNALNATNLVDAVIKRYPNLTETSISNFKYKFGRISKRFFDYIRNESYHYDRLESLDFFTTNFIDIGCESDFISPKKRELKDFGSCSEKQKKRRSDELLHGHTDELVLFAADRLRKKSEGDHSSQPIEAALAFFIDAGFTKEMWRKLRIYSKKYGNYFPEYRHILEEKKKCYPEPESCIEVTEMAATVRLQNLLDHTAKQIMATKSVEELQNHQGKELVLISKWGMDGSSGHSQYKQGFQDNKDATDSSLFSIALVPINLADGNNNKVWENPRPSSTRYCRPIKLEYAKETIEYTKQEDEKIQEQIQNLETTRVTINHLNFFITHKLVQTMVDGKVCNSLTENRSAATCNICNTKPSKLNDLPSLEGKPSNEEVFKYGLSTLHCWIRFMETILHISYLTKIYSSNDTKRHRLTAKEQITKAEEKERIHHEFKNKLQIRVDEVKTGFGTTNDGNTARRFFSDPELTASITGVDKDLITRFSIILQVLASGHKINCEKFEKYGKDTAALYVKKYPWHYMPTSVHKVLWHGSEVIRSFLVPIGQLSEEALEAGNKIIRNFREFHARKTSRKDNLRDILNRLLVASDPLITSHRILKEKKHLEFSEEALELLEDEH